VPFLFKLAIDWLAAIGGAEASLASFTDANATLLALFASPAAVLIGYGIARSGVSACTGKFCYKSCISMFFYA
jgi:ABC transporter ATM